MLSSRIVSACSLFAVVSAAAGMTFCAEELPCTYFAEDFSGLSANTWETSLARWYEQDERLHVDTIETGKMGRAETSFLPLDNFQLDVNVGVVAATAERAAYGFYVMTTGDAYFGVDGRTCSTFGVVVFAGDRVARLWAWDVTAGTWYTSAESVALPADLTSVGITVSADKATLRINKQNTSLQFTLDTWMTYLLVDKLRLIAQGDGTHVWFDDVCAGPLAVRRTLTVTKTGGGAGAVTSSPAGVDCGQTCSADFDEGTEITLAATAQAGSRFDGFSGGGCPGASPCTLTLSADTTVTATFTLLPTDAPPTVSITSPANGATVSGTVTIQASASDDKGVSKVEFYIDGAKADEDTAAPYEHPWDSTAATNAVHILKAKAYDTAAQSAEHQISVTVNNVDNPPAVSITSPANGATVSGTVAIQASATDDKGVGKVEFYVDAAKVGEDTAAPYEQSWDTKTSTNAAHTLRAKAYDTIGQSAESSVSVTVNNPAAPVSPISSPTQLLFPFYQGQTRTDTGFAVTNVSGSAARLRFLAYGSAGSSFALSSDQTLPAGAQLARQGWEIFGLPAGTPESRWVELSSDQALGGFFQYFDSNLRLMDGSVAFTESAKKLYFTRVFEGPTAFRGQPAATYLSIANPSDEQVQVALKLVSGGTTPTVVAEKQVSIPAKGFIYRSLFETFETASSITGGFVSAEVTQGEGIVGFELIELSKQNTVIGLNASVVSSVRVMYSAQLTVRIPGWFTSLKLVNTATQSRRVTLRPVGDTGNPLASSVEFSLAPNAVYEQDADEIFAALTGAGAVGTLVVAADGPGVIGDVVFGDSTRLAYAAALQLQTRAFTRAVFSQFAAHADYRLSTGLALHNPGAFAADVQILVHRPSGERIGVGNVPLAAGARIARQLTELVAALPNQVGGFIDIRSNRPLVAQELFFNADLVTAVPPTVVSMSIPGPGDSSISYPPESSVGGGLISINQANTADVVDTGEKAVSSAVQISVSGAMEVPGKGPFGVTLPVTAASVDAGKLIAKVRLTSGLLLPIMGTYDANAKTYRVELNGLFDGWVFALVESDRHRKVAGALPTGSGSRFSKVWITPSQWETFEWDCTIHDSVITDQKFRDDILPIARDVGITLQSAGFRSPQLWVDPQKNVRYMHFFSSSNPDDRAHFVPCKNPVCRDAGVTYDLGNLTQAEIDALGQVYINYTLDQNDLPNTICHEVFHAVQFGYGLRDASIPHDPQNPAGDWTSPLNGYIEGSASTVGWTYAKNQGNITSATALCTNSPFLMLSDPLDQFRDKVINGKKQEAKYHRQDFFAYLVKRYFREGGFKYLQELFDLMSQAVVQIPDSVATYAGQQYGGPSPIDTQNAYRKALDGFLRNKNLYGLSDVYHEFALVRAFAHPASLALHERELNDPDWKPYFEPDRLATPLFVENKSYLQWQTGQLSVEFKDMPSLSAAAAVLSLTPDQQGRGEVVLNFEAEKAEFKPEGMRVDVILQDYGVYQGARFLTGFDGPLRMPVYPNTSHLVILVYNCYVDLRDVTVRITLGDLTIDPPVIPEGRPGVEYQLTASTSITPPVPARYVWDFGDETPAVTVEDNATVKHAFGKVGKYTVKAKLLDSGGTVLAEGQSKVMIIQVVPNENVDVSFIVFRKKSGSPRQYCQDFKIEFYRNGQLVHTGTSLYRNGDYTDTFQTNTAVAFVVEAKYPAPDPETRKIYGAVFIQPDRLNIFDVETSISTSAVFVNPAKVVLPRGGVYTFYAAVTSVDSNTGAAWSLQEGGAGGKLTDQGNGTARYEAPLTPGTYHVVATSRADSSKTAVATVTVAAEVSVTISPKDIKLPPEGTFEFRVEVIGASNSAVDWQASGGEVVSTSDGKANYKAPKSAGSYRLTVTSREDTSKKDTATITVLSDTTKTLSYGPVVSQVTLKSTTGRDLPIVATFTASGSVTAPMVVGKSGSLAEPKLDGGLLSIGCDGAAVGQVQVSGSVNGTFNQTSCRDESDPDYSIVYNVTRIIWEKCWTTDQELRGYSVVQIGKCQEGLSDLSVSLAAIGGFSVHVSAEIEVEKIYYRKGTNEEFWRSGPTRLEKRGVGGVSIVCY
jgi:hypothetical protein